MRLDNLLVIAPAFPDRLNENITGMFIKEQIKYIKEYFSEVYVISPTTIWSNYIRGKKQEAYGWDNVHVYYPRIVNFPSPYVPTMLKKLWLKKEASGISRLIRSEGISFDLIHAHYTWYPGAVAAELKKEFGRPLVITEHTSVTLSKALKRKDPYFINTWANCSAVISVNRKTTSYLESFNKKSIYVPNGFDEETVYLQNKQECRKRLNIDSNINIILSLGSLEDVKGHKYLIDAMNEVINKRKDVLCLIGGSGPLKKMLLKRIKDADLGDYVELIGQIPRKEISTLINACDIFVLPSLSESFGIVQIEALACGKPVVATRNGGSEEIIISDEYGYLVETGNEMQLAEKISLALDKDWNEDRIRDYASGFSWKKIAAKIVSIYEDLEKKQETQEII